jgi:hypothetical protein
MRDDLHKKAPIPRKAQNVLKLAGRPADRCHPERLRDAAVNALDQAIERGLSPATIEALSGRDAQAELFGLGEGRQACSPTEGDLFSKLAGRGDSANLCEALERSLLNLSDSYTREVRATLVAEGNVRNVSEIVRAFSTAFEGAARLISANICKGEALPKANSVISLEENLLSPSQKRNRG